MADNVNIKDAADATKAIATDEVGGAHVQVVKPAFGADGAATLVSPDSPLPVALGSAPLAPGASTSAKQDAILAGLGDVYTALSAVVSALQATLAVAGSVSVDNLPATQPVSGSVSVSNFPATQPVSASSLPLPSGAATEASLARLVSSSSGFAVTPSDSVDLASVPNGLWVGTGGDVSAVVGGATLLYKSVPDGSVLPIRPTRVRATNTTASNIVAL